MGGPADRDFESFILQKGWISPERLSGATNLLKARLARGEKISLPDVLQDEKYLTPEQAVELTTAVKIPMSCRACSGRFKVGGRKPAAGWACPKCKGPLEPVVEVPPQEPAPAAGEPVVEKPAPLPSRPGRSRTRPKKNEEGDAAPASPKKKPLVLWISAGGAAAALLITILVVALSGGSRKPAATGGPEPIAAAETPDPEKRRRETLRADWNRAAEAVEAAKRNPELVVSTLALLEGLAERARGTEIEARARQALAELRPRVPLPTEDKVAAELRELVDRGNLRGAANLIRGYRADPATPPALRAELAQLSARIAEAAPAEYLKLLAEARALADAGKAFAARERVLDAASWGVPLIEERARRDAQAFIPDLAAEREAQKLKLAELAKGHYEKLEPEIARLEAEGKLQEAITACDGYPFEYRDTPTGDLVRKRGDRLRERLADAAALPAKPAEPVVAKPVDRERKTEAAPSAAAANVSSRGPRTGEYKPGGLPEAEKQKKHAALMSGAEKEKKGAAKAAAAKRSEWLAKLEKDLGIYDVATIADKGDVAKRVDIVIVSSGYSKADAKKVNQTAEALKTALLKVDPFQNYPDYINFHRINVDDPGTAGRAHIPFQVETNILTCDRSKAMEYARVAPGFDLVVVLCNVAGVRATGGPPVITIDADLDIGRTFLHEMGHAFASLNDEYVDTSLASGRPFKETEEDEWVTNVTAQANPKLAKWHYWIPDAWPAAHDTNRLPPGHKVGCFEGAAYQTRGVFRPEAECLMRHGDKYCVICFEQVEKKFYRLIAPIDDARPRRPAVALWGDDPVTLEADAIRTAASGGAAIGKFEGFWYVDGKLRHGNAKNLTTSLTLQAAELGVGVHEAGLRVDFSNRRVRRDDGWLSSSIGWKIDVLKVKRPKWEAPAQTVQAKVGQPVSFDVKIENPDPAAFRIEVHALPKGAAWQNGKVSWTPGKEDQGAWRPRFVLTDGLRSVEKSVDIAVLDMSEKNFPPVFSPMESRSVAEGESLDLPIEAVDVDGDNLVFTSPNLPEGAELDVYEGVIRWKPTMRQAGKYPGIQIEIFDGRQRTKGTVDLVVEDRTRYDFTQEDVVNGLRSAAPQIRARALAELGSNHAALFQCLEATRLLRDKSKTVREAALEVLTKVREQGDAAIVGMLIRDLAPHVWHFTDQKEILAWLDALAAKAPSGDADARSLRSAVKAIEKYNKERGF